jgi:hypothetical protein
MIVVVAHFINTLAWKAKKFHMSAWTEKKYHTSAWKVKKFHRSAWKVTNSIGQHGIKKLHVYMSLN